MPPRKVGKKNKAAPSQLVDRLIQQFYIYISYRCAVIIEERGAEAQSAI